MSKKSLREKAGRFTENDDSKRLSRRSNETYRSVIRSLAGQGGEALWVTLMEIAQGKAWVPRLPDGREGPPQVPSTTDRRDAAIYLANALFGKPVPQTELVKAEAAATHSEDLRAMSDDDLQAEVRRLMYLEGDVDDGEVVDVEPS